MNEKKFIKTYHTADNTQRVDIAIGAGYKNIDILFNEKEIGSFANSDLLEKGEKIVLENDLELTIKYLPKLMDFEVFVNDEQIDRSSGSPYKVMQSVNTIFLVTGFWYIFTFIFFYVTMKEIWFFTIRDFSSLFTPHILYSFTSTLLVILLLVTAYIFSHRGNQNFYYLAVFAVGADLIYSLVSSLAAIILLQNRLLLLVILGTLIPMIIKAAFIFIMIKYRKKFMQYCQLLKRKSRFNSATID